MDIHVDVLTDEELLYLVKSDLNFFLEPIKQNQKHYAQYTPLLGNMSKKSLLVPKNLPSIAVKLFRRQDMNYVKAVELNAAKLCNLLIELVNATLDREVTVEEFCGFTNEQVSEMLVKFREGAGNQLEIELFKVQMKLIGFPDVDARIHEILSMCGMVEETDKEIPKHVITENSEDKGNSVLDKKQISSERKGKVKKLTSEEKAALAAKEKAKIIEEQTTEAVGEDDVEETLSAIQEQDGQLAH